MAAAPEEEARHEEARQEAPLGTAFLSSFDSEPLTVTAPHASSSTGLSLFYHGSFQVLITVFAVLHNCIRDLFRFCNLSVQVPPKFMFSQNVANLQSKFLQTHIMYLEYSYIRWK